MGQKVNPHGIRVGVIKDWDSRWYAEADFADNLVEDYNIRKFLKNKLKSSSVSKIEIERAGDKIKIIVTTARPGVVIGKKGAEIDSLRKKLEKVANGPVSIEVVEVKRPELDAALIAQSVAEQLEGRVAFRRAMRKAVQSARKSGAKGIRIQCSGRLGGAEMSRREWYREGRVPLHTLRAKIDMASPNMNLRDPAIYRIVRAHHHRQGDKWCIYPLYDFAHPIQDALEGITHSMCSIEFENHRPLYEWVVDNCPLPHHPKQREFARLNVTHTVMSKRYLRQLVFEKHVEGWDDPRMPTLCALRRRGYTPSAILDFVQRAGIAKANSLVDIKLLEHCIREELNETALRRMAVTEPVKLVITNYPEGQCEEFEVPNNPRNEEAGSRKVPFTRELYIEKSDFAEVPPPKFQRLKPDGEVRLMGAYIVKCNEIVKDDNGEIVEIRCTADLETRNGMPVDGRKVKGTIHWVSAEHAIDADLYLYDNLFTLENVNDVPEGTDYLDYLNPDSLKKLTGCKLEPSLADAKEGERFQFVRMGYYCKDRESGRFNRIVTLKDSFAKTLKK